MHYVMYALTAKENAQNSKEAREYVHGFLLEDNTFVGEGGLFRGPIADWFVIGGRWSGILSDKTWAKDINKKIKGIEEKENIEVQGVFYGEEDKQKRQERVRLEVEELYKEVLPVEYRNSELTFTRDSYQNLGYEDDGMIVTEELFNEFIKPLLENTKEYSVNWGKIMRINDYNADEPSVVDLEEDVNFSSSSFGKTVRADMAKVKKQIVGKKWMVVVDYHT